MEKYRMFKKANQNRPETFISKATQFKDKQIILKNAEYLEDKGIFN